MGANVVSPVFIGRQDEMRALERLLDRAQAGDAAFALIGGPALGGGLLRGTDSPAPVPAADKVLAG